MKKTSKGTLATQLSSVMHSLVDRKNTRLARLGFQLSVSLSKVIV